jgi:transcriptional regulator with XRE-family HTH domain
MTFGEWLKRERLARRLTYRELGDVTGVDFTMLHRIERGTDPLLRTLTRICTGLGYKLSAVFNQLEEQ